jgi:hypothetical protein
MTQKQKLDSQMQRDFEITYLFAPCGEVGDFIKGADNKYTRPEVQLRFEFFCAGYQKALREVLKGDSKSIVAAQLLSNLHLENG